jgi:hypothetical protein
MTVRVFLGGSFVSALAAWSIWLLIINWLDPLEAGVAGLFLFFLTLFLAVESTAALVGYGVRRLVQPGQLAAYRVRPALRQGIWLGIFLNLLLFLQLQRLLQWWITVLVVILFLSLELVFLSYDKGVHTRSTEERGSRES